MHICFITDTYWPEINGVAMTLQRLVEGMQERRHYVSKDRFDDCCQHLMVIDNRTGKLVAITRLLSELDVIHTGSFYSETEFEISRILDMPGRIMEMGRTCIHPDYRKGSVLALLWQGIARIVAENKIDHLIGCASLPLSSGDQYLASMMNMLREKHYSDKERRVRPLVPLKITEQPIIEDLILPPMLKAYLRQGAMICGEPYWDTEFGVADVFVLLNCDEISARYMRHFMHKKLA